MNETIFLLKTDLLFCGDQFFWPTLLISAVFGSWSNKTIPFFSFISNISLTFLHTARFQHKHLKSIHRFCYVKKFHKFHLKNVQSRFNSLLILTGYSAYMYTIGHLKYFIVRWIETSESYSWFKIIEQNM